MDLGFLDGVKSLWCDQPFNLEFAVTRKCSSRCLMCNQWKMNVKDELTVGEITRAFRSYDGFKIVGITGGEPTLRPDLAEIVNVIIDTQPHLKRIFITTNGFQPNKAKADTVKILNHIWDLWPRRINLTMLVSIDGPKDLHNQIRGRPFAYQKATETLRILAPLQADDRNFKLGAVSTYGPFNYREYDDVLANLRILRSMYDLEPAFCFVWYGNLYGQKDAPAVDMGYMDAVVHDRLKIMNFLDEQKNSLIDARSLFWRFSRFFVKNPQRQVIPCEAASVRYYLDSQGQVFPCIVWDFKLGSLRQNDYNFPAIFWKNDFKAYARQKIRNHGCPICFLTCEFIPAMMSHPVRTVWKYLKDVLTWI